LLATYLGWNITAGGARPFHQNQICNYVGGRIPFAKTKQERRWSRWPRRARCWRRELTNVAWVGFYADSRTDTDEAARVCGRPFFVDTPGIGIARARS